MNNSKFSSFEQLQKSYEALEKQFTKKCQLLAQLQAQQNATSNNTVDCDNCQKIKDMQQQTNDGTSEYSPPQSEEQFFEAFPKAEKFKGEILQKISDPMYQNKPDGFVNCYIDFLETRLPYQQIVSEPAEFLQQQLLSNPQIADKLLQVLFSSQTTYCPPTICGNNGDMTMALPTRPKTITEASELAKKYFK